MWLSELTVHHCRIIEKHTLLLSPTTNFIYGNNGSGKTSLLEALSILSFGRSFRTSRISEIIQYGHEHVMVSTLAHTDRLADKRIGIQKTSNKTIIRVNKQAIKSQSELSKIIPISFIQPLSHQIITGSASLRRNFIDWIAFYQQEEFHPLWKRYKHILKQRNAALKNPHLHYAIEHLTYELCKLQAPIHELRLDALKNIKATLQKATPDFLSDYIPELSLHNGLPTDTSLDTQSLINYYKSKETLEKKRGRTLKGIHCADLVINFHNQPASTSASRGQIKILSLLLHIAQSLTITQQGVIAIDDLSAEIDRINYEKILQFVLGLNRQLFITSTEKAHDLPTSHPYKMFHVKHGSITQE